ncbi:MEDS domain-containing protein [Actinacidiphila acidipaludis]|uniref:MEDS domain-containing protein n=1 Tax=Actinacidiphila acidipaludis TaxID=2873382 RepID=A0ABS7Q4G8_9ACTN|nr:MEDS domain-containing protein [Streptomyces acidipaludis]MBY8877609.1 MEDS domain-containing protein [Streptomyces acidipaludis]
MAGRAGGARTPRAVAVERLAPGDHACLPYDAPGQPWAVRAAFAAGGLARGERVLLFTGPDTDVPKALDALEAYDLPARQAAAEGRLAVVRDSPGYDTARGFDAAARAGHWVRAADDARSRGFTGLRAAGEMAWAAGPGVDPEELRTYELGLTTLFAELGCTALCEYDHRAFPAEQLEPLLGVHPLSVVPATPGTLHAVREGGVLRLAGDADLATRGAFELAVRETDRGVIDLTGLAILDAHCARELARLGGTGGLPVVLECTDAQARLLRICGLRNPPAGVTLSIRVPGRDAGGSAG